MNNFSFVQFIIDNYHKLTVKSSLDFIRILILIFFMTELVMTCWKIVQTHSIKLNKSIKYLKKKR